MAAKKQTKVVIRRKKFIPVQIPAIETTVELLGNNPQEIEGKSITLDLTRQLKGKSVEGTFKVIIQKDKAVAVPTKIKLMSYFIRRMIRKRISYVEDSFQTPTQETMLLIKPFLITRKRVSRAVRNTLRNKMKNWLEDYCAERTNEEIFGDILNNKIQKPLSLMLKKTYPLSLCEIRHLEVKRPLQKDEIPKITKKKITLEPPKKQKEEAIEEGLDQMQEIEEERIKKAEKEMKQVQGEAEGKAQAIEEKKERKIKEEVADVKKAAKKEPKEKKKKEEKEE